MSQSATLDSLLVARDALLVGDAKSYASIIAEVDATIDFQYVGRTCPTIGSNEFEWDAFYPRGEVVLGHDEWQREERQRRNRDAD